MNKIATYLHRDMNCMICYEISLLVSKIPPTRSLEALPRHSAVLYDSLVNPMDNLMAAAWSSFLELFPALVHLMNTMILNICAGIYSIRQSQLLKSLATGHQKIIDIE